MPLVPRNPLRNRNAFLLRLVGEHRTPHHIADRPDVGEIGAAIAVDLDEPALIELEPDAVRAEARGIRNPPYGDDQSLALKLSFAAPFCRILDRYSFRAGADAGDRRAQEDVEAL